MKVKVGLMVRKDVGEAVKKLFAAKMNLDGVKTWQFIKFRNALGKEGETINEAFKTLNDGYIVEENGQQLIPADKVGEWQAKVMELNNQDVELPDFFVKLEDFDFKEFNVEELSALTYVGVLVE